jgi:hypothetical protein
MSLRSLLSSLKYPGSRQECSEEAGLIISKRLKDLIASADRERKTAEQPAGMSPGLIQTQVNDSSSPAVNTAASSGDATSPSCNL